MQSVYVCPETREPLQEHEQGLLRADGRLYSFIPSAGAANIPGFLAAATPGPAAGQSLSMYDHDAAVAMYRNFLDWLFLTFDVQEARFRQDLVTRLRLRQGDRVLITGCGLGEDIKAAMAVVGPQGVVYANDLSSEMVAAAARHLATESWRERVFLSVCDAQQLPFADGFFDAAFHFGGINLFDDMKLAISEMARVVRPGGRVVFGDEGLAPWLKETEYGRIAVTNNPLWAAAAPLDLLPQHCRDASLTWVLGNCFYVIDFEVAEGGPFMNIDVPHKGWRGGSMRTRYFGKLEGVGEEARQFVLADAQRQGISVHAWLEQVINEKRQR